MLEQLRSDAVRLGTPRLILRAPQSGDAPAITSGLNDLEVSRMLATVPAPYRLADARDWLGREKARREAGESWDFIVTRREDPAGLCIGMAGLSRRADGQMHLGFWLARPFWGRGLMTEAVTSVLRLGFTALALRHVHSGYFRDNDASRRVHEKMGFAVTGEDMLYCLARKAETPHISLALSRHYWRRPSNTVTAVS